MSVEESVSREKRHRDLNVVQTLQDRHNLHKFLERKAELAVRGEKVSSEKFSEAEAEIEIRNWEKRNSDSALHGTNQALESQRLQLQQASRWADQAQRDFKKKCIREIAQKIAKKLKNCVGFVAKKQIEQELTNCPCIKRGILRL